MFPVNYLRQWVLSAIEQTSGHCRPKIILKIFIVNLSKFLFARNYFKYAFRNKYFLPDNFNAVYLTCINGINITDLNDKVHICVLI